MARKRNEARSTISEGGTAPVTRRRTSHVKAAQHAEPAQETPTLKSEPAAVDAGVQAASSEHEEISKIAYAFWDARGRQGGSHEEDWLRAEQEFHRRRAAADS